MARSTREEAIERAVIATRQYAKRQRTWFRNRMGDWPRVYVTSITWSRRWCAADRLR